MLFSEVYGSYFAAVAEILVLAVEGGVTHAQIREIVQRRAFGESGTAIPQALKDGTWPLLDAQGGTPLRHPPRLPLTLLERRFMKALLLDPRIRLFGVPQDGLEDVQPLYTPEMFVCFDRYSDGDPYDDPAYIAHFRAALQAVREGRMLHVEFLTGRGVRQEWHCRPVRLEYSEKDDKFRLHAVAYGRRVMVNLSRMTLCVPGGLADPSVPVPPAQTEQLVLTLVDERDAMERAMLHFSHYRRETERIDDMHYRITIQYAAEDETELLIRVLSFGPLVRVEAPQAFADRLRGRLSRQRTLLGGGRKA
ncbi:MAG: WYL domain-containing protein [Clostridia bacterium]|nr:WYL domain-containing protein [Clostridia bacterium]